MVLIGGQEAKTVVSKGSLVLRFPMERDYPEGTAVRPLNEDEFLQTEGERLCLYRRGPEDDVRFVCYVDLMERVVTQWFPEGLMHKMRNKIESMRKTLKKESKGS